MSHTKYAGFDMALWFGLNRKRNPVLIDIMYLAWVQS